MDLFGLALTVVVMLAIAMLVLLFERRRAREIERDLTEQAERRRHEDERDDHSGDGP